MDEIEGREEDAAELRQLKGETRRLSAAGGWKEAATPACVRAHVR